MIIMEKWRMMLADCVVRGNYLVVNCFRLENVPLSELLVILIVTQ